MKINKVVYGGATLLDLTGDTVNPDTLVEGYTAHDASGEEISGTLKLITVDDALDANSTNPIQNNVVVEALNTKADKADTYTKTEVDELVENSGGGSSEDCLSSKGGTIDGDSELAVSELLTDTLTYMGITPSDGFVWSFIGSPYDIEQNKAIFLTHPQAGEVSIPAEFYLGEIREKMTDGTEDTAFGTAAHTASDFWLANGMLSTLYGGIGTVIFGGFGVTIESLMGIQLRVGEDESGYSVLEYNLTKGGWAIDDNLIATSVNGVKADQFGNIEIPISGGDNPFVIENGLLCISVEE